MQHYILIPLGAFLLCSSLAGAMLARGARVRTNQLVAGMMMSSAVWALLDLMVTLTQDAEVAVIWLRAISFPALSLGPLCLLVLAELQPASKPRVMRLFKGSVAAGFVMGGITVATPWSVVEAVPLASGRWGIEIGPLCPLLLAQEVLIPFGCVWALVRARGRRRSEAERRQRKHAPFYIFGFAFLMPLVAICVTDVVLPLSGWQVPRLGALNIAFIVGFIWYHALRDEAAVLTRTGFAREVLDGLPDGVALLERDGAIRTANRSLARLVGVPTRRLVSRSTVELLGVGAEELATELKERETTLRNDHGEAIPVSIASARIRDRQQGAIGLVLVVRDMRRLDGLRRQLVASGRLAATGELAAGIAHEINNPVAFIQANLNLIRRFGEDAHAAFAERGLGAGTAAPEPHLAVGRIEASLAGVEQIAAIVRDVQGFARTQSADRSLCDVNELLASALRLAALQSGFHENVECEFGELPPIHAAAQDLKQVFLGLIRRACGAVDKDGRVRVVTRARGARVEIEVEDDADTWSGDDWGDVFCASFDAVAQGPDVVELGISQHLVQRQGGELWLEAVDPVGSRVHVSLPVAGADVEGAPA